MTVADGSLRAWFRSLLRSFALRGTPDMPERAGAAIIIVLSLFSLALWFGFDWLQNQPQPTLVVYGLPGIGWYFLGILMIAALIARCARPKLGFSIGLTWVLALTPLAIVVSHVASMYLDGLWQTTFVVAAVAYFVAYLARALQVATGQRQPAAVACAFLAAAGFTVLTDQIYVEPDVWYAAEGNDDPEHHEVWEEAEPLLFSQPGRIDAALAQIPRVDDREPHAFFVGFAGYGEQRVFGEEIQLAAQTLGRHFGFGLRRLLLINDRRDREEYPLATATSLRYALRGVAARMNREQDILFLSLSSHGSEDWSLAVSNGQLPLSDLSAEELAEILQSTGIKWRVIVISACYAGGFIERLRDPQTIVIAAAAADRSSFGCSDERDLTYFGEAFYRDALAQTGSLRNAFAAAKAEIAAREEKEHFEPSDPQAWFGPEVESRLKLYRSNAGDALAEK
jgi:hypothetical protein